MKKTIMLSLGFIVAVAAMITFSAFTQPNKGAPAFTAGQYIYMSNSDDVTELRKISNWQIVDEFHPAPEDCPETDEVPCFVNYTGSNFSTYVASATLGDLLGISVGTKTAQ